MADQVESPKSSEANSSDVTIIVLAPSYEAFGMAIDFLARTDPFGSYETEALAKVVLNQLKSGHNLAAMRDNEMIGYAGWLLTTEELGEEWTEGRTILRPLPKDKANAAALTVFASGDSSATTRLIRGAREINKGVRVFFKRGYDGTLRDSRKNSVLNFSND